MKDAIDRELLVKYIHKKCTAPEIIRVKQFLTQPEWQQALNDLLEEDFAQFAVNNIPEGLGADWNRRFQQKHFQSDTKPLWRSVWLQYAAACLLLASVGFYFWGTRFSMPDRQMSIAILEKINPRGQRSKIILPDSSVVYLGAESKLKFPEKFSNGNRDVSLTGEAFFEVTKDKKHPFIIHSGTIQTRVLGTSFKIDAFPGKNIAVSVATGKVRVDRETGSKKSLQSIAVLIPGQAVIWNATKQTAARGEVDIESIRDWKDGNLNFVSASLADVAETLERGYNVKIGFNDQKAKNYHVTLTVKTGDPLTQALDIICNTTHLKFTGSGHSFTILKSGGR